MNNLTKRQHEIYQTLIDHFRVSDLAPSLDELCHMLGLSSRGSLHKHIQALIQEGLVAPIEGKQRGIQLISHTSVTAPKQKPGTLPYLGKIAAGTPIEALENSAPIEVPDHLRNGDNCFVLKVSGDSMIDEGIFDGDWVIIKQTNSADNGHIVVALIDGYEATLKTIQFGSSSITLLPANPNMQPMIYAVNRVEIQGRLIGQMRSYC